MSDEKPLHVRVAEALGQKLEFHGPNETAYDKGWYGLHDGYGDTYRIPRYDTDWSATGPLIERFGVEVMKGDRLWRAVIWPDGERGDPYWDAGPTPLVAICLAVLKLSEAGKLDA